VKKSAPQSAEEVKATAPQSAEDATKVAHLAPEGVAEPVPQPDFESKTETETGTAVRMPTPKPAEHQGAEKHVSIHKVQGKIVEAAAELAATQQNPAPLAQEAHGKSAAEFATIVKQLQSEQNEPVKAATEDAAPRANVNAAREVLAPQSAASHGVRETTSVKSAHKPSATMETVPDTVVKSVRLMLSNGEKTLNVRLAPPSLGELHIQVSGSDDAITVRLVSSNPAVRDALEGQLTGLREILGKTGVSLTSISVSADAGSSMQSGGGHFAGSSSGQRYSAPDTPYSRPDPAPPPRHKSHFGGTSNMLDVRV
jgi:flagellar hook-length control protein FliK